MWFIFDYFNYNLYIQNEAMFVFYVNIIYVIVKYFSICLERMIKMK